MDKSCTVYRTADIIGKKWTLLILLELYKGRGGKRRYSELRKSLGRITPKMLSARLRELEKEELVKRRVESGTLPLRVEYSLTGQGKEFIGIIRDIKRWSLRWKPAALECGSTDCRECDI